MTSERLIKAYFIGYISRKNIRGQVVKRGQICEVSTKVAAGRKLTLI